MDSNTAIAIVEVEVEYADEVFEHFRYPIRTSVKASSQEIMRKAEIHIRKQLEGLAILNLRATECIFV